MAGVERGPAQPTAGQPLRGRIPQRRHMEPNTARSVRELAAVSLCGLAAADMHHSCCWRQRTAVACCCSPHTHNTCATHRVTNTTRCRCVLHHASVRHAVSLGPGLQAQRANAAGALVSAVSVGAVFCARTATAACHDHACCQPAPLQSSLIACCCSSLCNVVS